MRNQQLWLVGELAVGNYGEVLDNNVVGIHVGMAMACLVDKVEAYPDVNQTKEEAYGMENNHRKDIHKEHHKEVASSDKGEVGISNLLGLINKLLVAMLHGYEIYSRNCICINEQ